MSCFEWREGGKRREEDMEGLPAGTSVLGAYNASGLESEDSGCSSSLYSSD